MHFKIDKVKYTACGSGISPLSTWCSYPVSIGVSRCEYSSVVNLFKENMRHCKTK